jgi:hypothetical protein
MVIFGAKQTPKNWSDAEDVKELAAYANAFCVAHFAACGQIESLARPDGEFGETFLTLEDLLPHREGKLGVLTRKLAGAPVAVGDADGAKLLRVLDGNGTEANRINELEDGGVCSDAEGERKDSDDGESGTEAQQAKGVAKVALEIGHSYPSEVSDEWKLERFRGVWTALIGPHK